jgi:type I restriction enzyme, S subunit
MISSGPSVLRLAEFVNGYPFKPDDLGVAGPPVVRIRQLLDPSAEWDTAAIPDRPVFVDDGDLVFSWSATLAARLWRRGRALLNQHLFRVDPRPGVDRRWLRYVLDEAATRLEPLMHGSAMTHITIDMLRQVTVELPSTAEQRAIADYLDCETARIDALIEKKQRHIGLLEERWLASILQIAGGQLMPERKVQSGLAWLRTVPESWPVMPIRRLASVRRGASPRPIDDLKYFDDDGEYAWVRISDVSASEVYLLDTTQRLSVLGSSLSVKLDPGSLFLSIAGSVGKPIISRIKCCIHDGFVYFDDLQMVPLYLYFLFASGQPYLGLGKLGTQLNLNTNTIGSICVPVPPVQVQIQLVSQLEIKHDCYRRAVAVLETQLGLLNEKRQALITATVSGLIPIPGAA